MPGEYFYPTSTVSFSDNTFNVTPEPSFMLDLEPVAFQDPEDFVKEMRTWLIPPEALEDASQGHKVESVVAKYCDPEATDVFPDALSTMGTIRKRFYALNWGTSAEKSSSGRASSNGSTKRR